MKKNAAAQKKEMQEVEGRVWEAGDFGPPVSPPLQCDFGSTGSPNSQCNFLKVSSGTKLCKVSCVFSQIG